MPLWSIQNVWCLTVARTSTPRVVSRSRTFPKFSEGSPGGMGACVGVHKRTSSNDPSLSTISCAVGISEGGEMRIYSLSHFFSNTLTTGGSRRPLSLSTYPLALSVMSVSVCLFYGSWQLDVVSHNLLGWPASVVPQALQELSCSAVRLTDISIGNVEIIDEDSSCIDLQAQYLLSSIVISIYLVMNIRCE